MGGELNLWIVWTRCIGVGSEPLSTGSHCGYSQGTLTMVAAPPGWEDRGDYLIRNHVSAESAE